MSPALWGRKTALYDGQAGAEDIVGQIGRLWHFGHLTKTQSAAGVRIGEIYRNWHRCQGIRASAKSATLEQGFGGSSEIDYDRLTREEIEDFESVERRAREAWEIVDDQLKVVPRNVRQAVMDVCVFDTATNPMLYADLRLFLERMADVWGDAWKRAKPRGKVRPPAHHLKLVGNSEAPKKRRMVPWNAVVVAIRRVLGRLRPDLEDDQLELATDTTMALIDRSQLNERKR